MKIAVNLKVQHRGDSARRLCITLDDVWEAPLHISRRILDCAKSLSSVPCGSGAGSLSSVPVLSK